MTKRTAEEALVGDVSVGAVDCGPTGKEPRSSPSDGEEGGSNSKCGRATISHRVSLLSSASSSSSSIAQASAAAVTKKPLCRTVTSLDSTVGDDDCDVQTGQERGSNGSLDNVADVRQITRLINARILQRDGSLVLGSMDLSGGLIVAINFSQAGGEEQEDCNMSMSNNETDEIVDVYDCQGKILSPGFIDIQLNGAYGVDFSNDGYNSSSSSTVTGKQEAPGLQTKDILHVAHRLTETGVTSFCPTMVSSSPHTYRRILSQMRKARRQQRHEQCKEVGAHVLGMHLEGPFFAPSKRGAHDQQHIVAPVKGMESVEEVYGINEQVEGEDEVSRIEDIDIVTLAPELPGALEAIQSLTKPNQSTSSGTRPHSVVVSCGHTEATYENGIQAVSNGATLLTHLYNAMNPFHHRKPGLVGLLSSEAKLGRMSLDRPFYSLIVDGIHVHESAVCMAYSSHSQGCVLVTDAMTAMGLGDGEHSLGNMKVSIKGDRATLAGTDTLAGSVVSMDTCVKRFHHFTGCSIGEALLCATLHPAMVLKRHNVRGKSDDDANSLAEAPIGVLEVGYKADLVLLNDELDVLGTWVLGQVAFQKK